MSVTRDDVARLAGVSSATVSYVINHGPRPVSEQTKVKVLKAIEELGYQPSAVARSLKTKRTTTIGVIVSDIVNPVISAIAKGIEDSILQLGCNMILCNSDEEPERELKFLQMLVSKQADGIILQPTGGNMSFLYSFIEHKKKPLVFVDRQFQSLSADCVLFDNEQGAYEATRHLIELGHHRIALLILPRALSPGRERANGYRRALIEAGIPLDPGLVAEDTFKAEEGWPLARSLLECSDPPTALLVTSNRLLNGVLQYGKAHQIRIPQDLAIAVFDDVPYFSYFNPSITAVAADVDACGREAARLLHERICSQDPCDPRTIRVPCELRIRESTIGRSKEAIQNRHP